MKRSKEAELDCCDDIMNFMVLVKLFLSWHMKDHDNDDKTKIIGKRNILL